MSVTAVLDRSERITVVTSISVDDEYSVMVVVGFIEDCSGGVGSFISSVVVYTGV